MIGYILYIIYKYCILHVISYILYSRFCILYVIYYITYIIYYILCIIYLRPYQADVDLGLSQCRETDGPQVIWKHVMGPGPNPPISLSVTQRQINKEVFLSS